MTDGRKQPVHVGMKNDAVFAFAGLWSRWGPKEEALETCTIITTEANELCQHVHDRMPVILAPEDYPRWLDYRSESAA
jgi:putative SOS response-associated peptidase YedK